MSNIASFGEPVYSCSLKQGIHDGFQYPNGERGESSRKVGLPLLCGVLRNLVERSTLSRCLDLTTSNDFIPYFSRWKRD